MTSGIMNSAASNILHLRLLIETLLLVSIRRGGHGFDWLWVHGGLYIQQNKTKTKLIEKRKKEKGLVCVLEVRILQIQKE